MKPEDLGRLMEQAISGQLAAAGALRQVMKDLREIASAGGGDVPAPGEEKGASEGSGRVMTWEEQVRAKRRREAEEPEKTH